MEVRGREDRRRDEPGPVVEFPTIVYAGVRTLGKPWYLIGVVFLAVGVVGAIVEAVNRRPGEEMLGFGVVLVLIGLGIALPGAVWHASALAPLARRFAPFLHERGFARRAAEVGPADRDALYAEQVGAILFHSRVPECGTRGMFVDERAAWRAVGEHAARVGVSMPRCVVSERLMKQCRAIPLTGDLLEPEEIGTSIKPGKFTIAFEFGMLVIFAVLAAESNNWILVLFPAIYLLFLLHMRFQWLQVGFLLGTAKALPIAGCGVVTASEGRRWTRRDSLMLVQADRMWGVPIVTMFGPPEQGNERGRAKLQMTFANTADPHFVALWRRWNHLDPKPDLLT